MDFNISLEKDKSFNVARDDLLILQPEREHITVKSTSEPQKIYPSGEMVIGSVQVEPIVLQHKNVTPTDEVQNIVADDGYDGLSGVVVQGVGGEGYQRPFWYPNVLDILHGYQPVEKDGVIYYPVAILLLDGSIESTTKLNYVKPGYYDYDAIGGDAYIFSDNTEELVVSGNAQVVHDWDTTKDFTSPENDIEKVRWVLVFSNKTTMVDDKTVPYYITNTSNFSLLRNKNVVEFWADNAIIGASSATSTSRFFTFSASASYVNGALRFIYIGKNTKTFFADHTFRSLGALEEIDVLSDYIVFPTSVSYTFYGGTYSLKKINIPTTNYLNNLIETSYVSYIKNVKEFIHKPQSTEKKTFGFSNMKFLKVNDFSNFVHDESVTDDTAYRVVLQNISEAVEEIILPTTVATKVTANAGTQDHRILKMKIPPNIKEMTKMTSVTRAVVDIELYDDFDISGQQFAYDTFNVRSLVWIVKLCGWLKDKTNDVTAGTMLLGSETIDKMKKIYITFDAVTKKDINVANATTDGAMTAFDFLTTQKNWTFS